MPKPLTYLLLSISLIMIGCNDNNCEEDGKPANRQENEYYPNKKIRISRAIRNCVLDGDVTYYYENGKVEHVENYKRGVKSGIWKYYSRDNVAYQTEAFNDGILSSFSITDFSDSSYFSFDGKRLTFNRGSLQKGISFNRPTTLHGNDIPFVSIYNNLLLLRGSQDYYVVDKKLNIQLDLRDTLINYIPSAYKERTDANGNKFTFNWHRDIVRDTLKVRVFYDRDENQSSSKIWERYFLLKMKTARNNSFYE